MENKASGERSKGLCSKKFSSGSDADYEALFDAVIQKAVSANDVHCTENENNSADKKLQGNASDSSHEDKGCDILLTSTAQPNAEQNDDSYGNINHPIKDKEKSNKLGVEEEKEEALSVFSEDSMVDKLERYLDVDHWGRYSVVTSAENNISDIQAQCDHEDYSTDEFQEYKENTPNGSDAGTECHTPVIQKQKKTVNKKKLQDKLTPRHNFGNADDAKICKKLKATEKIAKRGLSGASKSAKTEKMAKKKHRYVAKQLQHMSGKELEELSDLGTWVQCSLRKCQKWRYLPNIPDPIQIPEQWECSMHPDERYNNCDKQEEEYDDSDHIFTKYTLGSVVWAKMDGYPWWPGLVDTDPDDDVYCEIPTEESMHPTHFHIVFFDDMVTRSWIRLSRMKPLLAEDLGDNSPFLEGHKYRKQMSAAIRNAQQAAAMPLEERTKKFGFAARYHSRREATKKPKFGPNRDAASKNRCGPVKDICSEEGENSFTKSTGYTSDEEGETGSGAEDLDCSHHERHRTKHTNKTHLKYKHLSSIKRAREVYAENGTGSSAEELDCSHQGSHRTKHTNKTHLKYEHLPSRKRARDVDEDSTSSAEDLDCSHRGRHRTKHTNKTHLKYDPLSSSKCARADKVTKVDLKNGWVVQKAEEEKNNSTKMCRTKTNASDGKEMKRSVVRSKKETASHDPENKSVIKSNPSSKHDVLDKRSLNDRRMQEQLHLDVDEASKVKLIGGSASQPCKKIMKIMPPKAFESHRNESNDTCKAKWIDCLDAGERSHANKMRDAFIYENRNCHTESRHAKLNSSSSGLADMPEKKKFKAMDKERTNNAKRDTEKGNHRVSAESKHYELPKPRDRPKKERKRDNLPKLKMTAVEREPSKKCCISSKNIQTESRSKERQAYKTKANKVQCKPHKFVVPSRISVLSENATTSFASVGRTAPNKNLNRKRMENEEVNSALKPHGKSCDATDGMKDSKVTRVKKLDSSILSDQETSKCRTRSLTSNVSTADDLNLTVNTYKNADEEEDDIQLPRISKCRSQSKAKRFSAQKSAAKHCMDSEGNFQATSPEQVLHVKSKCSRHDNDGDESSDPLDMSEE